MQFVREDIQDDLKQDGVLDRVLNDVQDKVQDAAHDDELDNSLLLDMKDDELNNLLQDMQDDVHVPCFTTRPKLHVAVVVSSEGPRLTPCRPPGGSLAGVKNEKTEPTAGIKKEGGDEVPHSRETESRGHPPEEEPDFGSDSESEMRHSVVREEQDEDTSARNPVGEIDVQRAPIQPLKKPSWAVDSDTGVLCKTTRKRVYPPQHPPLSG
eukprot:581695-Amphidinium_carterae.1